MNFNKMKEDMAKYQAKLGLNEPVMTVETSSQQTNTTTAPTNTVDLWAAMSGNAPTTVSTDKGDVRLLELYDEEGNYIHI